jgi:hypothetical protein
MFKSFECKEEEKQRMSAIFDFVGQPQQFNDNPAQSQTTHRPGDVSVVGSELELIRLPDQEEGVVREVGNHTSPCCLYVEGQLTLGGGAQPLPVGAQQQVGAAQHTPRVAGGMEVLGQQAAAASQQPGRGLGGKDEGGCKVR